MIWCQPRGGRFYLLYKTNTEFIRREAAWWHNVECVVHIHAWLEIVYVTEGTLSMTVAGTAYDLKAKEMVYIEPYEPHTFHSVQDNVCCIIEFPTSLSPVFWDRLQHHTTDTRVVELPVPVAAYLDYLLPPPTVLRTDTKERQELNETYIQLIAQVLTNEFMTRCRFRYANKNYDDIYIAALIYISQNLNSKFSLSDVAHHIGVAPETLSRRFSKNSSMGFNEYVHYMRVCTAADYLQKGRSVSEAAMNAGFGSTSSFNRMFKKVTSMTPMQYRNLPPEEQVSVWNGIVHF